MDHAAVARAGVEPRPRMPFKDAGREPPLGDARAEARPVDAPADHRDIDAFHSSAIIRFRHFPGTDDLAPRRDVQALSNRSLSVSRARGGPAAALALLVAMIALSRDFGETHNERALQSSAS